MTWHILIVHPNCEAMAMRHLIRQKIVAYLPMFSILRRSGRNKAIKHLRPMIPGYVFVENAFTLHNVDRLPGVHRFLSIGDQLAVISLVDMDRLRAMEKTLNAPISNGAIGLQFKIGEVVRLIEDMWEGIYARITGIDKSGRISLETSSGRLLVQSHQIEAVSS